MPLDAGELNHWLRSRHRSRGRSRNRPRARLLIRRRVRPRLRLRVRDRVRLRLRLRLRLRAADEEPGRLRRTEPGSPTRFAHSALPAWRTGRASRKRDGRGARHEGGGRAALSGDCAMLAGEVQNVLKALRRGGIELVELHNHHLAEGPRLFFTHIWAVGDGVELARAVRAAVDTTNVVPSG
ncbi:DUF1259 domain-containing protein [Streptomyces sp. NPDC015032]|uniref:DUF1259 domain-containing protein n=1 Tax=Streptomyces sp. NPDC015032 TaxID=3364937 RepID=UPI0036FD1E52